MQFDVLSLLAFLFRYDQALEDYTAADDLFTQQRSPDRALDARANRYCLLTRAYILYDTLHAVKL
jgi:hypothetical protein